VTDLCTSKIISRYWNDVLSWPLFPIIILWHICSKQELRIQEKRPFLGNSIVSYDIRRTAGTVFSVLSVPISSVELSEELSLLGDSRLPIRA
jgi:hypothetical protein